MSRRTGSVGGVSYAGPPPTTPPPPGWQPTVIAAPAPPRHLPAQDHSALDAQERAALRFTLMVAAAAGLVLLVVVLVLIARMA